ncbi:hypothetical protein CEXT_295761 [Caerostris extrusa]|uniref:Uncharacterized protein n=1 Tax=Caerostris extrusa TaxID=172846 RepID=A0AAV4YB73_CAEEX|nr:hypothetical protein CEXT_295761 [Caerostris extrusa]
MCVREEQKKDQHSVGEEDDSEYNSNFFGWTCTSDRADGVLMGGGDQNSEYYRRESSAHTLANAELTDLHQAYWAKVHGCTVVVHPVISDEVLPVKVFFGWSASAAPIVISES